MREIFHGDIPRLKLFKILKTLLVGKKTGMLTIRGKEMGEIVLEAGGMVHSKTSRYSGEEAFQMITNNLRRKEFLETMTEVRRAEP